MYRLEDPLFLILLPAIPVLTYVQVRWRRLRSGTIRYSDVESLKRADVRHTGRRRHGLIALVARKGVAESPDSRSAHRRLAKSLYGLGDSLVRGGREAEATAARHDAVAAYRESIRLYVEYTKRVHHLPSRLSALRNTLAWILATCPDPQLRNGPEAVELAQKAVKETPDEGRYWNTLGVAHCRVGNWEAAVTALKKSMERGGGGSIDWFFLAMAQWNLGEKEVARKWYDQAVEWMETKRPGNDSGNAERARFRAEAAALLGIAEPPQADGKDG